MTDRCLSPVPEHVIEKPLRKLWLGSREDGTFHHYIGPMEMFEIMRSG